MLVDVLERRKIDVFVFGLDIEHLTAHHPHVAGAIGQFLNQPDLARRVAALHQIRTAAEIERHRQQRVAGQDRHRFAIDLVIRRLPAPEVVVVHRRQVVVNERVGMDQFQRAGDRHQSRRGLTHRFCRGNRQDRADPLSARHETVPHAFVQGRRRRGGAGMTESRNRSTSTRFCSR